MAIYRVGAAFDGVDVSQYFIDNNVAGIGWPIKYNFLLDIYKVMIILTFIAYVIYYVKLYS